MSPPGRKKVRGIGDQGTSKEFENNEVIRRMHLMMFSRQAAWGFRRKPLRTIATPANAAAM